MLHNSEYYWSIVKRFYAENIPRFNTDDSFRTKIVSSMGRKIDLLE